MGKRSKATNAGTNKEQGDETMEKQIVTKETGALMMPEPGGFFYTPTATDIILPKILPLHYMSEKVKDKHIDAKAGEMRDTLFNEKFGDTDTPFEFIPFGLHKFWTVCKKQGNEFIEKLPWTPGNANRPFEDGDIKNYLTYEAFVLLPSKLKEGYKLPYVLSFRSTSAKTGKMLANQQMNLAMQGQNFWNVVFSLSVKEDSNDQGDFFVQAVSQKRSSTKEEREEAQKWFTTMQTSTNVKVDDSDLKEPTNAKTVTASKEQF